MRCHCTSNRRKNPDSKETQANPPIQTANMDESKAEVARKQDEIKNSTIGGF